MQDVLWPYSYIGKLPQPIYSTVAVSKPNAFAECISMIKVFINHKHLLLQSDWSTYIRLRVQKLFSAIAQYMTVTFTVDWGWIID